MKQNFAFKFQFRFSIQISYKKNQKQNILKKQKAIRNLHYNFVEN